MSSKLALASILAALAYLPVQIAAHGHITSWGSAPGVYPTSWPYGNNRPAGSPQYVTRNTDNGFVADLGSALSACNTIDSGAGTGLEAMAVTAGQEIPITWNQWPESHRGPVDSYLASCNGPCSAVTDPSTLSYFKISEDVFDGNVWAGAKLASLKSSVTIPANLADGLGTKRSRSFAIRCCFPAAYAQNTMYKDFSVYGDAASQAAFVNYGPAVWSGAGASGGGNAPVPSATTATPSEPSVSASASSAAQQPSSVATVQPEPSATSEYPEPSQVESSTEQPQPTGGAGEQPVETVPEPQPTYGGEAPGSSVPPVSSPAAPAPSTSAGGSGGTKGDYNTCMREMNACKDKANSSGGNVTSAQITCDEAALACIGGGSKKRSQLIARYAHQG